MDISQRVVKHGCLDHHGVMRILSELDSGLQEERYWRKEVDEAGVPGPALEQ